METLGVRVASEVGTGQRPSAVLTSPVKEAFSNLWVSTLQHTMCFLREKTPE